MKRALVLSGGGSKGAFEVGAIAHLINKKVDFQLFTGTSVGALNAAFSVRPETTRSYRN